MTDKKDQKPKIDDIKKRDNLVAKDKSNTDINNEQQKASQKQEQQDNLETHDQPKVEKEDLEYVSDTSASILIKPATGGRVIIYTLFAFVVVAVLWARITQIEEITRGDGLIIPSSKLQIIQNLEGGILKKLFVKEGEIVKADQPLAQLDNIRFSSNFKEKSFEYFSELAKKSRLEAELNDTEIDFPEELQQYPEYIKKENSLYASRKQSLDLEKDILIKQLDQTQSEIDSARSQLAFISKSFDLINNELELTRPLVAEGVVSKVEMLQIEQRANDLAREKNLVALSIPKLQLSYQEAKKRIAEATSNFKEEIAEELKETSVNLDQLHQNTISLEDQLDRTLIRSPMDGVIKKVYVSTEGGVAQPGMSLMEIVPVEDNLLVEVQINPKDIGFLVEGMPATVKLTAYDFAIYGGLKGTVDHISADTHKNEKGDSYYIAHVRTDSNFLQGKNKLLHIIPGMRGSVDIITGKKTFMDYILKPILRAKQSAFTER